MLIVKVCIGSSCHLKGSHEIVEKMQAALKKHKIDDKVALSGSFCMEQCSHKGVKVQINDKIHTGISLDNFDEFFNEYILNAVNS